MMCTNTYQSMRKQFYDQHPHFFADIDHLEYALYDVLKLDKLFIDEINNATNVLWTIFHKVSKQFKHLSSDQLMALGIRKEMIPYIGLDYLPQQSVLARFDFICTSDGEIKVIELNGDTPFLISEAFEMNQFLCDEFNVHNPNKPGILIKSLSQALLAAIHYLNKPHDTSLKIVITGKTRNDDFEEFAHIDYIRRSLPFEIEYVPIKDLIIYEQAVNGVERGLYTADMERIDVLYRPAHPLEFLIDDVSDDEDLEPIGLHLLDLVKDRKLAIINSPAAYVLQSKILLWLIWKQKDNPQLFNHRERQAIQKYMLPTFIDSKPFTLSGKDYVKKPVFSREGNSVEIYRADGAVKAISQHAHYQDNLYIYQEYVEMPEINVVLNSGIQKKKWLIGSFVADGRACGLACRVGNEITEWDSHWLAVACLEPYTNK